jgi:hypothetical protein
MRCWFDPNQEDGGVPVQDVISAYWCDRRINAMNNRGIDSTRLNSSQASPKFPTKPPTKFPTMSVTKFPYKVSDEALERLRRLWERRKRITSQWLGSGT